MAIYSLHHSSIGLASHGAGTAGAHARYILRHQDGRDVLTHEMPRSAQGARSHFNRIEKRIRKNGRVLDKVMVALPREASPAERMKMVDRFCRDITQDRCSWLAALHENTEESHNPHAHIIFRDEDLQTGKRFLFVSDSPRDREAKGLIPKFTEYLRERWEHEVNYTLHQLGHSERVDRRSLKDQGIDRAPQIHIGPNAQYAERFVDVPRSTEHVVTRWGKEQTIDYPAIDLGRTRSQHNADIIDLELERKCRSEDPIERAWGQFEKDQLAQDRDLIKRHSLSAREFTLKERRIKLVFTKARNDIKERHGHDLAACHQQVRKTFSPEVYELKTRHKAQIEGLKANENRFWKKAMLLLDFTGGMKRNRRNARNALKSAQEREREALKAKIAEMEKKLHGASQGRYKAEMKDLRQERKMRLHRFYDSYHERQARENREWFIRNADRDKARAELEHQLERWRQDQSPDFGGWDRDFSKE